MAYPIAFEVNGVLHTLFEIFLTYLLAKAVFKLLDSDLKSRFISEVTFVSLPQSHFSAPTSETADAQVIQGLNCGTSEVIHHTR